MKVAHLKLTEERRQEGVIALLEDRLDAARRGELLSVLVLAETKIGYSYSRVGVEVEKAIGMHSRAIYNLHKDWDGI